MVGWLSFLYVRQGTTIRNLTAECALVQSELIEIQEVNHTLELEIEQAFSLSRVSQFARQRLGMIEPSVIHHVPYIQDEG